MAAHAEKPLLEEQFYNGGPLDGGHLQIRDIKSLKNYSHGELIWTHNFMTGQPLIRAAAYVRVSKKEKVARYEFSRYVDPNETAS